MISWIIEIEKATTDVTNVPVVVSRKRCGMSKPKKCKIQHILSNASGIHGGKMLCRGCREWVLPMKPKNPKRGKLSSKSNEVLLDNMGVGEQ